MARAHSAQDDFREVISSGELWRYFYEPEKQAAGIEGFAPNYMQNNLTALRFLMQADGPLSIDHIKQSHKICMTGISHGAYHEDAEVSATTSPGEFIPKDESAYFGVTFVSDDYKKYHAEQVAAGTPPIPATLSEAGFVQILTRMAQADNKLVYKLCVFSQSECDEDDIIEVDASEVGELEGLYGTLCEANDAAVAATRSGAAEVDECDIRFKTTGGEALEAAMEGVLAEYHDAIAQANTIDDPGERDDAVLLAIASFVQQSVLHHPFADGNGRLFQMVLPIKLCLENNIMPPLLNINPACYPGHTPEEMCDHMKAGIEAAKRIATASREGGDITAALPVPLPKEVVSCSAEVLMDIKKHEVGVAHGREDDKESVEAGRCRPWREAARDLPQADREPAKEGARRESKDLGGSQLGHQRGGAGGGSEVGM